MKKIVLLTVILSGFFLGAINAQVLSYTTESDGVLFKLQTGVMKVYVCNENIIRETFCADTVLPSKVILTVNKVWDMPSFSVNENDTSVIIETSRVKVLISKSTALSYFFTSSGEILLSEDSKKLTAYSTYGVNTNRCIITFNSPPDEAIYGLGQHQQGIMNFKNKKQWLDQYNKEIAIPVIISNKGYGLLWDNYSKTLFDGTYRSATKYQITSSCGEMIDYYFMCGPEPDSIISAYRTATGIAPLFPKWAYGFFQSKNRYESSSDLIAVRDEYRDNNIPVDCIVQDWYYWDPYPWGSNIMNPSFFPDPAAVVDSLHKENIHTMISIWATFTEGIDNYNEYQAINALYPSDGTRHYYDPHNEQARNIYWQQVRDQLFNNYGWDSWWADADEPDDYPDSYNRDEANTALGKGVLYHNTYPLMHTTSVYEGWRRDMSGKRLFTLSRCAFAGNQRNAAASWSGDISCSWNDFNLQLPAGLNFCLSGVPYWTTDIGGYATNWGPTDWSTPGNRELFTRWFEYGTFCPIFRVHGVDDKSLLSGFWDSSTRSILLKYDKLRYRLMPYIYSLGWMVTNSNYTIMRHLIMDFRTDPNVNDIYDQFMFGPSMMINPVHTQGATNRDVYLPESNWYNFWTGDMLSGGGTINTDAPRETIPIFVKAGSIIPMGPNIQYATQSIDPLEIRVYGEADAKFDLYEDEGDSYDYENGQYSIIPFSYSGSSKQLIIGSRNGTYNGMPVERTFNIVFVKDNHGTGLDITTVPDTVIHYDGSPQIITGIGNDKNEIPLHFNLFQNYPNPFNPSTTISYQLSSTSHVTLKVYDVLGKEVKTLVDEVKGPGKYEVSFSTEERSTSGSNKTNLSSGVYFYRLTAGDFTAVKKMLLIR